MRKTTQKLNVTTLYALWDIIHPFLMDKSYRLRHAVFCSFFQWCKTTWNRRERDQYDSKAGCHHLVITDGRCVYGYTRLIEGNRLDDFMVGQELRYMGPGIALLQAIMEELNGQGCAEISRLALHPKLTQQGSQYVRNQIYKSIAEWTYNHDLQYLFMIMTVSQTRDMLSKGYQFRVLEIYAAEYFVAALDLKASRRFIAAQFGSGCPWYGWPLFPEAD